MPNQLKRVALSHRLSYASNGILSQAYCLTYHATICGEDNRTQCTVNIMIAITVDIAPYYTEDHNIYRHFTHGEPIIRLVKCLFLCTIQCRISIKQFQLSSHNLKQKQFLLCKYLDYKLTINTTRYQEFILSLNPFGPSHAISILIKGDHPTLGPIMYVNTNNSDLYLKECQKSTQSARINKWCSTLCEASIISVNDTPIKNQMLLLQRINIHLDK